jgi:hypothetical protein
VVEFAIEFRLLSFLLFAALVVVDDGDARFLGALCANPVFRSWSIIFHTFSIWGIAF